MSKSIYAKPRKGHPILITLLVLLLVAVVGALVALNWLNGEINGTNRSSSEAVTVEIPKGAAAADIAAILEENDTIGSALVFRAYLKYIAEELPAFQYGSFEVVPMEGYGGIIKTLTTTTARRDTVSVTFPEGYNAYQMGDVLEKSGLCSKDDFLRVVQEESFTADEVSYWESINKDEQKLVRLDGYLFPDTYEFFPDVTVRELVLTMLQNFEKKALTDENKKLLDEQELSLEDLVVFASIIQKESANVEEMYNVSSVFHNRLQPDSGYDKLESCTTNNYIEDYLTPAFDGKPPQNILDAYDTYGSSGFPAGAIANAGVDALNATLRPNDTPYFFFVTDVEYTHYYGKTYDEHLANIEKAKAVNKQHGIDGLIS